MRRRSIIALATTAALTLAAAAGAPAAGPKKADLECSLELFAQGPPQGTPPSGIHFGFASCPAPFGSGVHYNSYTVTPTSPGHGTVAGAFKNYYSLGTTRGTFTLTFAATGPAALTYNGTVTYTGGTGAFRRVRGAGTIACSTTDGGAHKSCTVKSTLTGL